MKHLDFAQIDIHCRKSIIYQLGILFGPGAESNNLAVKKIQQDTDIMPLIINPDIGQIAYDHSILILVIKVPG